MRPLETGDFKETSLLKERVFRAYFGRRHGALEPQEEPASVKKDTLLRKAVQSKRRMR